MSKVQTIKLSHGHQDPTEPDVTNMDKRLFRVEQITDSTDYYPGQMLKKRDVNTLCHSSSWKVTIVSFPTR